MEELIPIGNIHILNKIQEAIESKDIVQILCTRQRGIEGWIIGYYENDGQVFCEILINKCTEQVEKFFDQYALILPAEIDSIILDPQNKKVYHPIRYKERL